MTQEVQRGCPPLGHPAREAQSQGGMQPYLTWARVSPEPRGPAKVGTAKERSRGTAHRPTRLPRAAPAGGLYFATDRATLSFFFKIFFLSNLYTQRGAQSHNPETTSRTLYRLSPSGAPIQPWI